MVPAPLAIRTGVEDFQKPRRQAHLPLTLAAGTGLTRAAGFRPVAPALGAAHAAFHLQAGFHSPGGFLQAQHHRLSQIRAGLGLIPSLLGASATEEFFEGLPEGAENIFEAIEGAKVQAGQPGITVEVIKLTLFRIGQDLVGFGNLFESVFRPLSPRFLSG